MGGIMSYVRVGGPHKIECGSLQPEVKASDLYRIAKTGSVDVLEHIAFKLKALVDKMLSPAKNTLLHVAAQHGNKKIVEFIAYKYPHLVLAKNQRGDTALHLAAKFGRESTVIALVKYIDHKVKKDDLLHAKNENGNTALHEALLFSKKSVAKDLIKQDPKLSYFHNKKQESAIYLAAKAGLIDCVSFILDSSTAQQRPDPDELFKKTSLIKEAFKRKDSEDVLEAMYLISRQDYTQLVDSEGRNPLHYAAYLGYDEMVRKLLARCASFAIQGDKKGSLPIHLASIKNHLHVVNILLKDYLDQAEELLDENGCTILHVAAKNGSSKVVNYVLKKTKHLGPLINMKDKDGNTALHLAAQKWQTMIVSTLTWDKRVDINAQNNRGQTAVDVAETTMQRDHPNNQWLTINALRTAGAVRLQSIAAIEEEETATNNKEKVAATEEKETATNKSIYKEKVNFRLLIAILIATVAYEAGFRLPYKQTSSMEHRLGRKIFIIYVFSNTIAMYSSISAAVVLGWAQSGDLTLVTNALNFTMPLFWLALSMMSMAFTAGVYLVINDHRWMRIASLGMGGVFHLFLFFNSLVLFSPIVSTNQYLRYLTYFPFRFLVLMNNGWPTNTSCLRFFMWSTQH